MNQQDILNLTGSRFDEHKRYWREKISLITPFSFIQDSYSPVSDTAGFTEKEFFLPGDFPSGLAGGNPMAAWIMLLGACGILLRKYARTKDVIIESPLLIKNLEASIQNPFVTLNLTSDHELSLRSYLNTLKAELKASYGYQNYPYSLAEEKAPSVFSNVLVGLDILHVSFEKGSHDLYVRFDISEGLKCHLIYDSNKFNKLFIDRFITHFKQLADCFGNLELLVGDLPLLPQSEREGLLSVQPGEFQKKATLTLTGGFSEIAGRQPESFALIFQDQKMTYSELDQKASAFALYLKETFEVKNGDIIAMLLERSEYMIISMLAIMKAGAAYLPLNPTDPADRLSSIMTDSGAEMLVTQMSLFNANLFYQGKVSAVDVELPILPATQKSVDLAGEEGIAYVIYTSGSTGKPKGVAVRHKGAASMAAYSGDMFELSASDTILQFASYTFDASVFEIYSALLNGSTLRLISDEHIKSTHLMEGLLESGEITIFSTTPSYLKLLNPAKLQNLRAILTAGEEAHPETISQLPESVRYFNGYGPTECSVAISFFEVNGKVSGRKIPLGVPRPGLRAYIVDQDDNLAFRGIPGELCISGIGLAAGYLNAPELNQKRFVHLPEIGGDERLYRTGDICQWDEQGRLIFVGRDDEQIKIRGFRVETGEISQALNEHTDISGVAIGIMGSMGKEYLAAYYTSAGEIDAAKLQRHMEVRVPGYMLPSHYIRLEAIPLTVSGKLDKKALPEPVKGNDIEYAAPHTVIQKTITSIWENEFGADNIGIDHNFFRLGGNSLKAISILNQLQEAFSVEVSFDDFFANPTIRELALCFNKSGTDARENSIPATPEKEFYRTPFQQASMWVRYEFQEVGRIPYNSGGVNEWAGLDVNLLKMALLEVINKHEILRSSFHTIDNESVQKVHSAEEAMPEIEYHDLSETPDEDEKIEKIIYDGHQTLMKLETPGLIRVIVIKNKKAGFILQIVIPHFIVDGWSRGVFERDLLAAYEALQADTKATLQPLPVQSKDYAEWYYGLLESDRGKKLKSYWKKKLAGARLFQLKDHYRKDKPPVLTRSHREKLSEEMDANFYPMKEEEKERAFRHIASAQTYDGAGYGHHIEASLYKKIKSHAELLESGTFTILLAGLGRVMQSLSGEETVTIGSVAALRNQPELQELIGSFINIVLYRIHSGKSLSAEEYIRSVTNEVRVTDSHKLYPFEYMLNDTDYSMDGIGELWLNFDSADRPMADAADSHTREHRDKAYPYFNLNLTFTEYSDGITMDITYKTDYFRADFVEAFIDKFVKELAVLTDQENMPLRSIYEKEN